MTQPLPRVAGLLIFATLGISACTPPSTSPRAAAASEHRLPTGVVLDPAGYSIPLGSMPVAMTYSPDSARVVVVLSGMREQGLQVIDPSRRRLTQTLVQRGAFLGAAFAPDGKSLWTSGGYQDVVYRYAWAGGSAALADSVMLDAKGVVGKGTRYPSGLAVSPDGKRVYVAENLADSLAVVDVASGRVVQRLATGTYPYGVIAAPDGRVYVSAWGGSFVATFAPQGDALTAGARVAVGRHPSAMALNAKGTRLFVARASFDRIAVVDTGADSVIAELSDAAAKGPPEGATPNGLALSADGRQLYVAEADNNAVAIFALSAATSDVPDAAGKDTLLGRVPVEWYPTAVLARHDSLLVLNGKGLGTAPNPRRRQPGTKRPRDLHSYTLGQTSGSLTFLAAPKGAEIDGMSARVAKAEGWDGGRAAATYPPFKHVIYVIKENRTYDQVLGDLGGGDGDTTLVYFPREVTPNIHALAERFGIFDRFFVNAEVSGDGHNWTTAAYASDYVEKTVPSQYSDRGRDYDFQGEKGEGIAEDDVAEPGNGYLWDAATRAGITMRNYGEYTHHEKDGRWVATKASLAACTAVDYPGWDLDLPDQKRVDVWMKEFQAYSAGDSLPALTFLWLPSDHTSGAEAGKPTPRAYVADNDLAVGRVIDALTHSPFWKDTVVFVLEDDAQDGPDHVDSHRSPLLVISAYNRPGAVHRFANTSDVVATIGAILHLEPLSQFDYFGRPLSDVFAAEPQLDPYVALPARVPLDERNPKNTAQARATMRLDLRREDAADEELFNRILWAMMKGPETPYPGAKRMPVLERQRG
ncbi:MAG: bifunctional YncE family protein/alkaline phosphatase family protein [bacterium]